MPQQAKTDKPLFATTVGLAFFGLVMVYSASSVMAMQDPRYHSSAYFVIRQAIYLAPGLALMMFMKRTSYPKLQTPAVDEPFVWKIVSPDASATVICAGPVTPAPTR